MSSRHNLRLPPEILTQILTKLPVKSILRFRCVRKTWYSLVSSPYFHQTLNQSTGDRLLVHRLGTGTGNFSFHEKSLVESREHQDVPELLRGPEVEIVGSCDGLVCLSTLETTLDDGPFNMIIFLIWNPSIRKLVKLPFRYLPETKSLFGFGFDTKSRDYKVVRVMYHKTDGSSNEVVVAKSEIFDLKKGAWRNSSSPMRPLCFTHSSAYVSGNLHWIGYDETSASDSLVAFNLSDEVFQEMGMVPGVEEINEDNGPMGIYTELTMPVNGLLSVAVVKEQLQGGVHQLFVSVWSMKEYGATESWAKLFNIELPCAQTFLTLVRCWENGEVLLVERVIGDKDANEVLVLYNPESRKSIVVLSTDEHILGACSYKESLISL